MNTKEINKELKDIFKNLKKHMNYSAFPKGAAIGFTSTVLGECVKKVTTGKFSMKNVLGGTIGSAVGYFVAYNLSYAVALSTYEKEEERKKQLRSTMDDIVRKAVNDPKHHVSIDDLDDWIKEEEAAEEANKYKEVL